MVKRYETAIGRLTLDGNIVTIEGTLGKLSDSVENVIKNHGKIERKNHTVYLSHEEIDWIKNNEY